MRTTTSVFTLSTLVVAGQAASIISSLSGTCQAALVGLKSQTTFSTCYAFPQYLTILEAPANSSFTANVNTWTNSLCVAPECDTPTLTNASNAVKAGCQADLQNVTVASVGQLASIIVGASTEDPLLPHQDVLNFFFNNQPNIYVIGRPLFCLESVANSTHCLSSLLNEVTVALGAVANVSSLGNVLGGVLGEGVTGLGKLITSLGDVAGKGALCTDCVQALASTAGSFDPAFSAQINSTVTNVCGYSFPSNGSLPSSIKLVTPANANSSALTSTAAASASGSVATGAAKPASGASISWVGSAVLACSALMGAVYVVVA